MPGHRMQVTSEDTSDDDFRAFAAEALRADPSAQLGPVLSQWRARHKTRIPLRDSLLRVFDEEERSAAARVRAEAEHSLARRSTIANSTAAIRDQAATAQGRDEPVVRAGRSGWWSRDQAWNWPFAYIALLPFFSVPATFMLRDVFLSCERRPPGCFDMICGSYCPTLPTMATLAPGLLGLACFLWFWSSEREVREAAGIALTLAGLRVLVPAMDIGLSGWRGDAPMIGLLAGGYSFFLSPLLWLTTMAAWGWYGVWGRSAFRGGGGERPRGEPTDHG
jgi:hypothetical protein